MRILTVHPGPHFSVADVFNGWVKGLQQAGAEVIGFPYDTRLEFVSQARMPNPQNYDEYILAFPRDEIGRVAAQFVQAACYQWIPDVVVVVSGMFAPGWLWDLVRARGSIVVALMTEQPYETDRELELARHVDLAVLNDPTNLAQFQAVTNAYYQPHSFDPDVHQRGNPDPALACDVGWVGTAFKSRLEFLEQVVWPTEHVRLGGMWMQLPDGHRFERWLMNDRYVCVDNPQTANLYRSCKASFNLYRGNDPAELREGGSGDGWAMGPREVELAACGTFFLRQPRPEGDELFASLPTFNDPGEFSDLLAYYLAHDAAREHCAEQAHRAVQDRTFVNAARRLLRRVETLRPVVA